MTKRQRWVVVFGILATLVFAILLMMMFSGMKKKMQPPAPVKHVRKVESAIVSYTEIEANVTGIGRVLSQHSIDIISEVQGKVLEGDISLKKGSNFNKGQLLAHIYNKDAVYNLKSRKSTFLNSLAVILPDMKIDYPASFQKWNDFFESINISKDLPVLPEISNTQEKVFLASRGILADYFSIKSTEEQLKKYNLWAPYSGSISEVMLEIGSVANPGSRVASIIKTGSLEVEVPLQIDEANWVRKGQVANILSENGHAIGKGKVVRKATYVDAASQSINVYIELLPGSENVYAGQYLKTVFEGMEVTGAMEIPRNATFNNNEVFVVDSGYLAKREINILKVNEKTLIFNGLEEGDEIVVQPLANATSNIPVQTQFGNMHKTAVPDSTNKGEKPVK